MELWVILVVVFLLVLWVTVWWRQPPPLEPSLADYITLTRDGSDLIVTWDGSREDTIEIVYRNTVFAKIPQVRGPNTVRLGNFLTNRNIGWNMEDCTAVFERLTGQKVPRHPRAADSQDHTSNLVLLRDSRGLYHVPRMRTTPESPLNYATMFRDENSQRVYVYAWCRVPATELTQELITGVGVLPLRTVATNPEGTVVLLETTVITPPDLDQATGDILLQTTHEGKVYRSFLRAVIHR